MSCRLGDFSTWRDLVCVSSAGFRDSSRRAPTPVGATRRPEGPPSGWSRLAEVAPGRYREHFGLHFGGLRHEKTGFRVEGIANLTKMKRKAVVDSAYTIALSSHFSATPCPFEHISSIYYPHCSPR